MPFYFAPVARLQRYLGKELIADPNVAVIEFIKNAYDANATEVMINFTVADRDREDQIITISDNGIGLDEKSFEKNWMYPGYSDKAELGTGPRGTYEISNLYKLGKRVPVGQKGIGRLSAGRLGELMDIYTRKSQKEPWLHVSIDWRQFENMNKLINEIPIPYEFTREPRGSGFSTGTRIIIEKLTVNWAGRLGGRITPGRSNFRLGRLVEDLMALLQPIPQEQYNFKIYFNSDLKDLQSYCGWLSPSKIEFFDYEVKLSVTEKENGTFIERNITRSKEIANIVSKPQITKERGYLQELYSEREVEELPKKLICGPFSVVIYYSPLSSNRLKELNVTPGVFIYRDGIRVEPYGKPENDWLGAMAWKAARQGYAPVQPSHLYGYFLISRISNPDLIDMTNRQGLIDNDASHVFLSIAKSEFRCFGDRVLDEYVRPQWETIEQKAKRAIERTSSFGIAIIKAIAHSVRQSLAGLGAELNTLHALIERYTIPAEMKEKLTDLEKRSRSHLNRIESEISRVLQFDLASFDGFGVVDIHEVLTEQISQLKGQADSLGIELLLEAHPRYKVYFNKQALAFAISVLITNGIEAARLSKNGVGLVKISLSRSKKGYEISVEDNGPGIPDYKIDDLFNRPIFDKGRPGVGLMLIKEAITYAGGQINLEKTDKEGSIFKIILSS